jgi:tRNA-splicing ligase RtcB (3'-phosphate/5'-hydroxy nucleic acid ligase)
MVTLDISPFEIASDGHDIKAWTRRLSQVPQPYNIEVAALAQLRNIAAMPFIHKHVAVMPDVHLGKGATIGTVIATDGAVIPAAVGVDIGCGMLAVQTDLRATDLPDSLGQLRRAIETAVPHGRTMNGRVGLDIGAWESVPSHVEVEWVGLCDRFEDIRAKHPKAAISQPANQLGTLGGGNHFIELCLDDTNHVWIMLHSGSRGAGNRIGMYFIERAKLAMEALGVVLPDTDLAYLNTGTLAFDEYLEAVSWAQDYAEVNRKLMLQQVVSAVARTLSRGGIQFSTPVISCHHNYVSKEWHFDKEVYVTRKGAVSAQKGELGIIPSSMGTASYIVRGKGNAQAFCSCSHGAGRLMSRGQAKRTYSIEDQRKQTEGVECRKDEDVIDEIPTAYKSIEEVMLSQSELVDPVTKLKQILCVKG